MARRLFITDKELAVVLEVSTKTLYRTLHGFFRKKGVTGGKRIDIRQMKPECVGGMRRWRISRVAQVLGVGEDVILDRIS